MKRAFSRNRIFVAPGYILLIIASVAGVILERLSPPHTFFPAAVVLGWIQIGGV
jgi:hypothetical protein